MMVKKKNNNNKNFENDELRSFKGIGIKQFKMFTLIMNTADA